MGLEDLTRYESAAIAAVNAEKDPSLALSSYSNFCQDLGEDFYEHPAIQRSLKEAAEGLNIKGREPQIRNTAVLQAIDLYGGKYEKAFSLTKFSDLINYLSDGYSLSDEVKEGLLKYNEYTYMDLAKLMKNEETPDNVKKEIGKAIKAVHVLKDRKFGAKTLGIINDNTTLMLNQLYPKPEEEKKVA